MGREIQFNAVNFEYRGTAYQKHHKSMVGGSQRFVSDKPCPKCGEYLRWWKEQRGNKTSACVSCTQVAKNRLADKDKCEKRRAIEAHQEKMGDYDEYL